MIFSSSSSRALAWPVRRPPVAARPSGPGRARPGAVGGRVLEPRVAVAELACRGRSRAARPAPPSRRPPRGSSGSARPSARGEASAGARVAAAPGLGASPCWCRARTATRASWRWAAAAAWAVDVAGRHGRHARAARRARPASGCGPGRGARRGAAARPGSRSGPNRRAACGPRSPRARSPSAQAARPVPGGRSRSGRPDLRRARAAIQRHRRLAGARAGLVAGVGVGLGQQPAEVALAGCVLDQQGEVEAPAARRDASARPR